jgi:hypothetical protein
MKKVVFWDVAMRSLAEVDRCFRGDYCLHHQDDADLVNVKADGT